MPIFKSINEGVDFVMDTIRHYGIEGLSGRYYGTYSAVVTNNTDPELKGRVRAIIPIFGEKEQSSWIYPGGLGGMNAHGVFYIPEVGDSIYLCFEDGDRARPIYIGGRVKGSGVHASMQKTAQTFRGIRTPSGLMIRFSDGATNELLIEHPNGSFLTLLPDGGVLLSNSDGSHMQMASEEAGGGTSVTDQSGATIFMKDGEIHVIGKSGSAANALTVGEDITMMSHGKINIQSTGKVSIIGGNVHVGDPKTGPLSALIKEEIISLFNSHTHGVSGAATTPPVVPLVAAAVTTSALKAK